MTRDEAEAIERATLAGLPPRRRLEDDGWVLAENGGAIGRANSVAPLTAGRDRLEDKLDRAEAFYAAAGLPAKFRVSPWSEPEGLSEALAARGYGPSEETLAMTADRAAVAAALTGVEPAEAVAEPDAAWKALFLGDDPANGALRADTVTRGAGARFAAVRLEARTAAIGALAGEGAWAGIHGMRTHAQFRRQGLARRVLARLVAETGAPRLFLQVEAANAGAVALYAGLGFGEAWRYHYWSRLTG